WGPAGWDEGLEDAAVQEAAAEEVVDAEEAAVVAAEDAAQQAAAVAVVVAVTLVDLVGRVVPVGHGDDLEVLADVLAAGPADRLGHGHVALAEDAIEDEVEGVDRHGHQIAVGAGDLLDLLLVEDQVTDQRHRDAAVGPGGEADHVGRHQPVEDRAVGEDDVAGHVDRVAADLALRLDQ